MTFDEQVATDLHDIFLKEYSQEAIYKSGDNIKVLQVQFFKEPLDKTENTYFGVWCAYKDLPAVKLNDTLIINNVVYGIVDVAIDEFQSGVTLFLNKA